MPELNIILRNGTRQTIDAPENHSIMQIGRDNNIRDIEGLCGGAMGCATCHCYIHPDWVKRVETEDNEKSEEETDMLEMTFEPRTTSRLGCQVNLTKSLNGLIIAMPGCKTDW